MDKKERRGCLRKPRGRQVIHFKRGIQDFFKSPASVTPSVNVEEECSSKDGTSSNTPHSHTPYNPQPVILYLCEGVLWLWADS